MTRLRPPRFGARARRESSLRADARERYCALSKLEMREAQDADPHPIPPSEKGRDLKDNASGELPLTERVRALYEAGVVPVREIAQIAGVSERTLYKYVTRGNWKRRQPAFSPAKGAGGRFIPLADKDEPHASGIKALDPQGAKRASASCERAGKIAIEAAARAQAEREANARHRAFEMLNNTLIELAKIAMMQREQGKSPASPLLARVTVQLVDAVVREMEALRA